MARASVEDRFWSKVEIRGPDECWPWLGGLDRHGYGRFTRQGKTVGAHRVAYELGVGTIPIGLTIDHVRDRGCTLRHCANPAHLEAVTRRENTLRGDGPTARHARQNECVNGHPFTPKNTYERKGGGRSCQECLQATRNAR
jgi:hypothetical protein